MDILYGTNSYPGIAAFIEKLAEREDEYGDEYPIICHDPQIETKGKKTLKHLVQENESIHFFRSYKKVLKFTKSLRISFILITPGDFDEQKFFQDVQSARVLGRRMEKFEEEELLKDLIEDISEHMIKGIKVYVFCTTLDYWRENRPRQEQEDDDEEEEEEDVTVMGDLKNLVKQFRQEFTIFVYDPNMNSEIKEKLTKDFEIEEKDFYTNEMELLQNLKNYNGPPYHLIMAGKDLEEATVNELVDFNDLLGLYLYCDDDALENLKNKKVDRAKTLEELIPKIKQGIRTRSKLRNNFSAFATDFNAWDRSHIYYLRHYLKGLINYKNRKQAKKDFLDLAKAIYQDRDKLLSQFQDEYKKYNKEKILQWYTRDSPIYKLINNCLRIATSDSILACRFVLKDMERAIRESYQEKDEDFNGLLYRGAYISVEEWNKLENNIGQEIEMYGFSSTSMAKRAALNFLRSDPQNKIFITIIVPPLPELDEQGFVDLSKISDFPQEKEILFNVRSKFQILQAATAKIDDKGTEVRHLVLLFGAQLLRKYMTKHDLLVKIELELDKRITQCDLCKKDRNLFGFQQDSIQIRCFDCLVKNSVPKDIPILAFDKSTKHIEREFKGKRLQFTQEAPSFSLSDYKCCDCQAKEKEIYYKWITQDGKELHQCSECFEKNKEIKAEILVSETYPYTMWLEHQKEWEKIDSDYKSEDHRSDNEGHVYLEVQDFHRCIEYAKRVLKESKLKRCKERKKLEAYKMLGSAYLSIGQHLEAEKYLKAATRIAECFFDPTSTNLSQGLADIDQSVGNFKEAKKFHEDFLQSTKLVDKEDYLHASNSYDGLALVCRSLGQPKQSMEYLKVALETAKHIYRESHPEIATSYNNLAVGYGHLSMYKEAKENFLRALEIQISIFGEKHPAIATTYHNFAQTERHFANFHQAIEYFEKSIKISEIFYKGKHLETAVSYIGLGGTYSSLGNNQKALECYKMALDITKSIKGEQNPEIAVIYNSMGSMYATFGKLELARDFHLKALEIATGLYGEGAHPEIASSFTNLALVYQDLGEYDKGLSFAIKCLEMRKLIYDEEHSDIASAYNNLARGYELVGKPSEVIENYTKALNIYKRVYGENHPETALVYYNLAGGQLFIEKYQEAKENLSKAYTIQKEILGDDHPDTIDSGQCLFMVSRIYALPENQKRMLQERALKFLNQLRLARK